MKLTFIVRVSNQHHHSHTDHRYGRISEQGASELAGDPKNSMKIGHRRAKLDGEPRTHELEATREGAGEQSCYTIRLNDSRSRIAVFGVSPRAPSRHALDHG